MNYIKRYLGIIWMLAGPLLIYFLVAGAINNIDPAGSKDINKAVPWVIIITIFLPIAIGLVIFGYYALKGAFDHLPASSEELEKS